MRATIITSKLKAAHLFRTEYYANVCQSAQSALKQPRKEDLPITTNQYEYKLLSIYAAPRTEYGANEWSESSTRRYVVSLTQYLTVSLATDP